MQYVFVSIKVKPKYGDISFENITQPKDYPSSPTFIKKEVRLTLTQVAFFLPHSKNKGLIGKKICKMSLLI